ncbi:hypothetical protein ACFL1R_09615, partial [Candidatus Latescibacterota bacterium]
SKYEILYKRKKYDREWYKLYLKENGFKPSHCSLWGISDLLDRKIEYNDFYKLFSKYTHIDIMYDNLVIRDGSFQIIPIRNPQPIGSLLSVVFGICLKTYKIILNKYRPGEISIFEKQYLEKWQPIIMRSYEINVHRNTIDI